MRGFTTIGLVLLTSCYDFVGERGRIGFASSLATGIEGAWTPEMPIASGSVAMVAATCLIDGGDGENDCDASFVGDYRARGLDGVTRWGDEGDPRFVFVGEAGDRGVIHYEDERVRDHFRVRFTEAEEVTVAPQLSRQLGDRAWAVLDGEPTGFRVQLYDDEGRIVGYAPDQLWVHAEAPLEAVLDPEEGLVVTGTGEDGELGLLTIGYDERTLGTVELRVTSPDADFGQERLVWPAEGDGDEHVEIVNWIDGWPVAPVE